MHRSLGTEGIVALWSKNHRTAEVEYSRSLAKHFTEMGKKLMSDLVPLLDHYGPVESMIFTVFPIEEWHEGVVEVSKPHMREIAEVGFSTEMYLTDKRTSDQIATEFRRGVPYWLNLKDAIPDSASAAIGQWTNRLMAQPYWKDVSETVRQQVADKVAAGARDGKSGAQVAKELQTILGQNGSSQRAMNIARTESTGALNAGHSVARDKLDELGVLKGKSWLCIKDSGTRPSHLSANGLIVGPKEKFTVGGEQCDHPGDTSLSAKERCNCRCTVLSILKSADELTPLDDVKPVAVAAPVDAPVARDDLHTGEGVSFQYGKGAKDLINGLFDREVSDVEMARMLGVPQGGSVNVGMSKKKDRVAFYVDHPLFSSTRILYREAGKLICDNSTFYLRDGVPTGSGLGAKVFATQVDAMSSAGVQEIKTSAARSASANGYYTWPRLGYDGPLSPGTISDLESDASLSSKVKSSKLVSDLMKTEEGRLWWKENGTGVDVRFDLTQGSQSRAVLNAYTRAKAKATPTPSVVGKPVSGAVVGHPTNADILPPPKPDVKI